MNNQSENIKVDCAQDCGNSPKKKLLKELTIALAKSEIDFWMEYMRDDVTWEIIGKQLILGRFEMEQALKQIKGRDVRQLQIHNIITHGNVGSVNGTLLLNGEQSVAFCDVYNFAGFGKNAKIRKITSYVIETK